MICKYFQYGYFLSKRDYFIYSNLEIIIVINQWVLRKKTCATNTEEKIIDLNKFVLQS